MRRLESTIDPLRACDSWNPQQARLFRFRSTLVLTLAALFVCVLWSALHGKLAPRWPASAGRADEDGQTDQRSKLALANTARVSTHQPLKTCPICFCGCAD